MTPAKSLLRTLAVIMLEWARNPVATAPTAELAAALHAFDASMQEAGDGLAPMVPEPAEAVLRRAREAMGEPRHLDALRHILAITSQTHRERPHVALSLIDQLARDGLR